MSGNIIFLGKKYLKSRHFLRLGQGIFKGNLGHSRPQSPSFLCHVVGNTLSRVALGTRMESGHKSSRMLITFFRPEHFETLKDRVTGSVNV